MGNSLFVEHLVGEQVGIREELVWIWELSERWEDILQNLVDQTKASIDTMELFSQGECFLRVGEMGKLEALEEVENVLRRHRRRLGTGSKEKEPEKDLERDPEVVPDVEMTLQ